MKDYDHIVIWLDYFNKTLSRQKGRRLAKNRCIFDPSLNELIESANDAGLKPTATDDQVRFPRRPFVRSGYIVLEKKMPKTKILNKIADKMVKKRAKPLLASSNPTGEYITSSRCKSRNHTHNCIFWSRDVRAWFTYSHCPVSGKGSLFNLWYRIIATAALPLI